MCSVLVLTKDKRKSSHQFSKFCSHLSLSNFSAVVLDIFHLALGPGITDCRNRPMLAKKPNLYILPTETQRTKKAGWLGFYRDKPLSYRMIRNILYREESPLDCSKVVQSHLRYQTILPSYFCPSGLYMGQGIRGPRSLTT
jgi:hypothetical protein